MLARRPEDGALVWAYQFTPHENWDFDANAEMILADLTIAGRKRQVLVHFDKNGFAYTIDRRSGEVLVAAPFTHDPLAVANAWGRAGELAGRAVGSIEHRSLYL